jgi:2-polyprenyl-3-methyl-5-hydroxy-6-metoxy-1,4-benzoquinol methylase
MEGGKNIWDDFWSKYKFEVGQDKQIIKQELSSVRWKKIEKKIISCYGTFKDLNIIEIGSGRGEVAAVMALKGARLSLLDYSQVALDKARILFNILGISATFINADAFNIPRNLLNSFDISMSFGLAEHFDYPLRQEIVRMHFNLLKPRGISFVAVPNKFCLPYRFFMKLSCILGYPSEGMEIPFSRSELGKIANALGFAKYEIVGSSFLRDSVYFLLTRYVSHLTKWRYIMDTSIFEMPTILDDYLGYSLVLMAKKNEN